MSHKRRLSQIWYSSSPPDVCLLQKQIEFPTGKPNPSKPNASQSPRLCQHSHRLGLPLQLRPLLHMLKDAFSSVSFYMGLRTEMAQDWLERLSNICHKNLGSWHLRMLFKMFTKILPVEHNLRAEIYCMAKQFPPQSRNLPILPVWHNQTHPALVSHKLKRDKMNLSTFPYCSPC